MTQDATPQIIRGAAYPGAWRLVVSLLFVLSRGSLLIIALLVLAGTLFSPPLLFRLLVLLGLLPGLAAVCLRLVFAADIEAMPRRLVIRYRGLYRRGSQVVVNAEELERCEETAIPFPGPGLVLSGAGVAGSLVLQVFDPLALLDRLGGQSRVQEFSTIMHYAATRAAVARKRWYHRLGKYGLFPLLPLLVVFRLHQNIMYGSLLGQFYVESPGAWFSSLVFHWILVMMYLTLWAVLLRGMAEGTSLAAARFMPSHALGARHWSERLVAALYYGGPLGLIVFRSIT